jgi:hypothetical protein
LEQISMTILFDRGETPAIALRPEERRRLLDLMAAAIIVVHRRSEGHGGKEGNDDGARE